MKNMSVKKIIGIVVGVVVALAVVGIACCVLMRRRPSRSPWKHPVVGRSYPRRSAMRDCGMNTAM